MSKTTSTTLTEDDLAGRYLVQTADMLERIERILTGTKATSSFPKTIPLLLGVFDSAHRFVERELKFPPLNLKEVHQIEGLLGNQVTDASAFILITRLYRAIAGEPDAIDTTSYMVRGEEIVRDLAYWTQGVATLQEVSEQTRPELERLKRFYNQWDEKGNASRRANRYM